MHLSYWGSVRYDGKDCYEIESTLASSVVTPLAKSAPTDAKRMMPAKSGYVIDKNKHFLLQMEVLLQNGSSLSIWSPS